MTAVWTVALCHTDKIVLLALADNANDEGVCWPSVPTLITKCGMSERSVQRVVTKLCESGHVTVHVRSGRSNYYTVHPRQDDTPARVTPRHVGTHPRQGDTPTPVTLAPTPVTLAPITIIEPSVESSRNQEVGAHAARAPTASRLPPDFELTPERRAVAEAEKADPDREFANFTDHWLSASGAKARKHDWDATWRIWCRRSDDFKPRRNGSVASAAPVRTWRPSEEEGGSC